MSSSQVTIANAQGSPDFDALAHARGTLVLFMGLARLPEIAEDLVEHGLDPHTPAAVISAGTTPDEEVAVATLGTIAESAADLRSPGLIVIGDVVALSERLAADRGTLALA